MPFKMDNNNGNFPKGKDKLIIAKIMPNSKKLWHKAVFTLTKTSQMLAS